MHLVNVRLFEILYLKNNLGTNTQIAQHLRNSFLKIKIMLILFHHANQKLLNISCLLHHFISTIYPNYNNWLLCRGLAIMELLTKYPGTV